MLLYSSETDVATSGLEASDEGSLFNHKDKEITNKGSASEPDIVSEGIDDQKCEELDQIEGETSELDPHL